jgi:lauroyl/myristoyl acyltransferase
MVRNFLKAENFTGVPDMFIRCFSYEWFAGMLVVFAAFIPFFAIRELGRVLGRGKISELFFRKGTETKTNLPE